MPHIRVRGVKVEQVQKLSENHHGLAALINTSPDNFTFEWVPSQFFSNGKPGGHYPFIEVLWFERGPDVRKAVARLLTARMLELNGPGDVAVVFQPLNPQDYFENGEHF